MGTLTTRYCALSTMKMAYTDYGDGSVLILLHGNSESKAIFRKYQTIYFPLFHTYALDSRGHGESVSGDEKYSIGQYGDDVIEFCNERGIRKANVIGYSDGGNISLFLGLRDPGRFSKIMAISPNYLVSGTTDASLRLLKRIYRVFTILNKMGINMKKNMMRFDLMLSDIGLSERDLGAIKAKMRILYAENDMIKEDHLIHIHQSIAGSSIRKINGCTHMNILKKQEAIDDMKHFFAVNSTDDSHA